MRLSTLKSSPLIRKIVARLVILETVILLLALIVAQFFLMPRLKSSACLDADARMSNLSSQVETHLKQYISYSQFVLHTGSIRSRLADYRAVPTTQNYQLLCLELTEQISSSSTIRGLQLETSDGTVFRSAINLREADFEQISGDWYTSILDGRRSNRFSSIYDPGNTTPGSSMIYSTTCLMGGESCILSIFLDCGELVRSIEAFRGGFDGILLTDFSNDIHYSSGTVNAAYDGAVLDTPASDKGHYSIATIHSARWQMICYVSEGSLLAQYRSFFTTALLLCAAFSVLSIIVAILAVSHIVTPINSLSQTMQRVSDGETDMLSRIDTDDEIGQLSRIFNTMLQRLNEHMQWQILFETNEQKMRYNLLIAQIDSHFIGNTMSTINSLARQGRSDDVIRLNTALMKIIQNNLRIRDLSVTDTVAQEMEIVEQYWLIMQIRQENHARLVWNVPDEVLEEDIPKNILQPLVENCLFHGLLDEDTSEINGTVTISMDSMPGSIRIVVRDDGKGISPQQLARLRDADGTLSYLRERGRHIGIANIRQRLQYLYGRDCLEIDSDNGAVVTITIPTI